MKPTFTSETAALTPDGRRLAMRVGALCAVNQPSPRVITKINGQLARMGGHVLLVSAQFSHPSDQHLQAVIVKRDHEYDPYVVWTHNSDDGGFFWGHYVRTMDEALKAFLEKAERYLF